MPKITVACVLRSGPEYKVEHVVALRDGVRRHLAMTHRFVALTDLVDEVEAAGVDAIPLKHDWPGWFSKIELFRGDLFEGPVFYADLDTIVVGPLDDIVLGHRFTVLQSFWSAEEKRIGSGLIAWDADLSAIYREFERSSTRWMREYKTTAKWGDQGFIYYNSPIRPERWQQKYPGRIFSYKRDILRAGAVIPASASVIAFHGVPRPWATPLWDLYVTGQSL